MARPGLAQVGRWHGKIITQETSGRVSLRQQMELLEQGQVDLQNKELGNVVSAIRTHEGWSAGNVNFEK